MNSSGRPADRVEVDAVASDSAAESRGRGVPLWLGLAAGFAALVFIVLVGWQVLGVLYGILFPPPPPVFPGMAQLSQTSPAYGVDTWRYSSAEPAEAIVAFYAEQGTCEWETGLRNEPRARCQGKMEFSTFVMNWDALITPDALSVDAGVEVQLTREVSWIGSGRQPTPEATEGA